MSSVQNRMSFAYEFNKALDLMTNEEISDPLEVFSSSEEDVSSHEMCSICLESLGTNGTTLPCRHNYHLSCLYTLVSKYGHRCSMCRADINFNWLHQIGLISSMSESAYLQKLMNSFGDVPVCGPLIPRHQRAWDLYYSKGKPIKIREPSGLEEYRYEMSMRLNISISWLTPRVLRMCLLRGQHGLNEWCSDMSYL